MALDHPRTVFHDFELMHQWHRALLTPKEREAEDRARRALMVKDTAIGVFAVGGIFAIWFGPWIALGWYLAKKFG